MLGMRAIWTGSISFGLVNIPVKMYSGSQAHEGLDLNMLHKKDHAPIRYARICRKDGKEIPYDEIEKGYEYQDGDYIVLTNEDFKKADAKGQDHRDKAVRRRGRNRQPLLREAYYLEPVKGAERAYALLRDALAEIGQSRAG